MKEVAERWEAGCHNIAQLHRELVAAGHTLTYKSVYKQLVRYFPEGRKNAAAPDQLPRPPVLARQAVFLFLRRPEKREAEEEETLIGVGSDGRKGYFQGPVSNWVDSLLNLVEKGVDTFILWPTGNQMEQIKLFGNEVVPQVKEVLAAV